MKESLLKLMANNPGVKFVVVINDEGEKDAVLEVMNSQGYSPIPPISNQQMLDYSVEDDGYPFGVRFKPSDLSVCTATIDHWKEYESDIVRFTDGKFTFVE